jgi:hypothetical protein
MGWIERTAKQANTLVFSKWRQFDHGLICPDPRI